MLRLQKHARPLTAITVATVVALVAFVPSIAAADRATPAPGAAAKKKKKKKKKQVPLIATVNGTFMVRHDTPGGFGGDDGPLWQQLKVVIKNAKIPYRHNAHSAAASANVRFYYEDEAHTKDRTGWPGGCDGADYVTSGDWQGWTRVAIVESYNLTTNGKSKQYLGWQVIVHSSGAGIYMETIGSYQKWDSILDNTCLTVEDNSPPGIRYPDFRLTPGGLGKLSSDGRSVRLNEINTSVNQWGTVSGSIKFNQPVVRASR